MWTLQEWSSCLFSEEKSRKDGQERTIILSELLLGIVCVCVCVCVRARAHECRCECMHVFGIVCVCVCAHTQVCMHACACAQLCPPLRPHGLQPTRLLCPWDSPSKNTGGGCHFLLQGIFPTQRSNRRFLCLLQLAGEFFTLSHLGGPSLTWQWCMKFHIFSENFTVKGEEENITREFHQDTKDISGSDYLWNFTSCWYTVLILTWNEIPILILYVLFLPSKMLIKWGIG